MTRARREKKRKDLSMAVSALRSMGLVFLSAALPCGMSVSSQNSINSHVQFLFFSVLTLNSAFETGLHLVYAMPRNAEKSTSGSGPTPELSQNRLNFASGPRGARRSSSRREHQQRVAILKFLIFNQWIQHNQFNNSFFLSLVDFVWLTF